MVNHRLIIITTEPLRSHSGNRDYRFHAAAGVVVVVEVVIVVLFHNFSSCLASYITTSLPGGIFLVYISNNKQLSTFLISPLPPLFCVSGGAVPQVWREVSHPGSEAAVRADARLCELRGPVGLRRGRHGQAVLQGPAGASAHEQARGDLPAYLPV